MKDSSLNVKNSILEALKEEKESSLIRWRKILLMSFSVSVPLIGICWIAFSSEINFFWLVSFASWIAFAGLASFIYWQPQPRIVVPGFWTRWMYSKIFFLFLILSALQLLICPHLAMVAPSPYLTLNLFEPLQHLFMSWGGMASCMFFCGLCFAILASGFSFLFMRKAVSNTGWRIILKIVGLAALAQLPIVAIQLSDAHLRAYFLLWLLGSPIGVFCVATLFSMFPKRRMNLVTD